MRLAGLALLIHVAFAARPAHAHGSLPLVGALKRSTKQVNDPSLQSAMRAMLTVMESPDGSLNKVAVDAMARLVEHLHREDAVKNQMRMQVEFVGAADRTAAERQAVD